ncbi:hypothetical protein [Waddlia chondrophila]|uniref:Uncharacterized protein n=2 Tax=Waddlia chondrophila TaxID=71667 RepID=D6YW24_WADCW|nr:hypothetical protein [Waddlia chondrophila]ADI38335.1 hypothetical protein wcw_0975 [Waddlia chondrophila WSU 86-1044]
MAENKKTIKTQPSKKSITSKKKSTSDKTVESERLLTAEGWKRRRRKEMK